MNSTYLGRNKMGMRERFPIHGRRRRFRRGPWLVLNFVPARPRDASPCKHQVEQSDRLFSYVMSASMKHFGPLITTTISAQLQKNCFSVIFSRPCKHCVRRRRLTHG